MTTQLELLGGVPVQPGTKVTDLQRHALEVIGRLQPVESDELGAYLHEDRAARGLKGHQGDARCEFCGTEGARMGRSLRKAGLVRWKRGAGWVLADYTPTAVGSGYDPAKSEIPY